MIFTLHCGSAPLLVSMPHIGTDIPPDLQDAYMPRALAVEDTDWHLDLIYDFLPELGASVLKPRYSRYVIDLNRPPDDAPMYPGAANTELCPTRFFTGDAIYKPDCTPSMEERSWRRDAYWQPYHTALATELQRIKAQHGYALLWDAHSIRSQLPWLFEGTLPGLNIGTANGASAHASIAAAVDRVCADANGPSHVLNGRFKGGYITRRYGSPQNQLHALQLEMCRYLYMREDAPFDYNPDRARQIQPLLKAMMNSAVAACRGLYDH
jgi:N-formylglutamate deformylase